MFPRSVSSSSSSPSRRLHDVSSSRLEGARFLPLLFSIDRLSVHKQLGRSREAIAVGPTSSRSWPEFIIYPHLRIAVASSGFTIKESTSLVVLLAEDGSPIPLLHRTPVKQGLTSPPIRSFPLSNTSYGKRAVGRARPFTGRGCLEGPRLRYQC